MRARIVLAALFATVAAGAGLWLVWASMNSTGSGASSPPSASGPASGAGSSASLTQTLTPTPTPTPTALPGGGGGGVPDVLDIYVSIDIVAQEPTEDPDGMVDIPMFASALAHFPRPGDAPVTVTGTFTIGPHPVGAAGCSWPRTLATDDFTMTVLPPAAGSNGVSLLFEAPEWHYTITCPTNPPTFIRLPAFGELTMLAYLGYAFPEFGPPAGGPIEVPPVSVAPDCIRREVNLQRSVQLADVTLRIVIYEPPCLLPLP